MPTAAASKTVGLIVRRSPRQFATDPFYVELIGGLEKGLGGRGLHVLMRAVDSVPAELAEYRRWSAQGCVCAVVLVDLVPDDPRPAVLVELGLPAVVVGEPDAAVALPAVRSDNYTAMRELVRQLVNLGHRSIARVTGLTTLSHTGERTRGYLDELEAAGLEPRIVEGDYSPDSGAAATRSLLSADPAPTAVVYDNDVMALAGLRVAGELGIDVPGRVSLVAWDDSHACQLADPPLSALSHDVHGRGVLAGRSLLAVLDGADPGDAVAPASVFVARGTTAPPPSAADQPASRSAISIS